MTIRTRRRLPAESIVLRRSLRVRRDPNQIDDDLIRAELREALPKLGIRIADHEDVGAVDHFVDAPRHQAGDVWNVVEQELAVCTDEAAQVDVAIVDAQLVTLAEQ